MFIVLFIGGCTGESMKIFIDVGAHFGECVLKALQPKYDFDLVLAYEPSLVAVKRLSRISDKRLEVKQFGLGEREETLELYGAGYLGASLYSDKEKLIKPNLVERVQIKDASEELKPLLIRENKVWLKINCEGGEIAIINQLDHKGLLPHFAGIYVDWDARKVPSLRHLVETSKKKLELSRAKFVNASDFDVTGWLGVERWLLASVKQHENPKIVEYQDIAEYRFFRFPWSILVWLKVTHPQVHNVIVKVLLRAKALVT